jgi:predicted phage-related endonuclease
MGGLLLIKLRTIKQSKKDAMNQMMVLQGSIEKMNEAIKEIEKELSKTMKKDSFGWIVT